MRISRPRSLVTLPRCSQGAGVVQSHLCAVKHALICSARNDARRMVRHANRLHLANAIGVVCIAVCAYGRDVWQPLPLYCGGEGSDFACLHTLPLYSWLLRLWSFDAVRA